MKNDIFWDVKLCGSCKNQCKIPENAMLLNSRRHILRAMHFIPYYSASACLCVCRHAGWKTGVLFNDTESTVEVLSSLPKRGRKVNGNSNGIVTCLVECRRC
jgi:hypothetical protein